MKKRENKHELAQKKECPCKKAARTGGFIACTALLLTLVVMYKRSTR